jgi:hypothetical protein
LLCEIGSGSFADVVKGELKIKCAVKRMRPLPQQEASVLVKTFVREGEMMRVASGVRMCKAVSVHPPFAPWIRIHSSRFGTSLGPSAR